MLAATCGGVTKWAYLVRDVVLVGGRGNQRGGRLGEVGVRIISAAGVAGGVYRPEIEHGVWALVASLH